MKTFRQNLNIWLEEKKNMSNSDEVIKALEEVQKHIKSKEKEEESMVNNSYQKGYDDREFNRGYKPSFYSETYKMHDHLKRMLKHN
jgi:hypothetical protein